MLQSYKEKFCQLVVLEAESGGLEKYRILEALN